MTTRMLQGQKAMALLTLLALLLLLSTAVSSAKLIKGKRSRLRTLSMLDHIFEPESDILLKPAHVINPSSSSSNGGKACAGKAKAKKKTLLMPLSQPSLEAKEEGKDEVKQEDMEDVKKDSTHCTDDEVTEEEDDTKMNSVDDACSNQFGDDPLPEPLISEGFHLGMNLGIDPPSMPAAAVGEILQNFLNSIVVDDLATCSSSWGDHRSSQDGSILRLDFDVDDDTVKCLYGVTERMGVNTEDCSEFNVGVSVIHDGLETNILVLAVIQGIQDRCNLIAELDGVVAVDELCAFYVGGNGIEGDDFTTGDETVNEDEGEDFSGDIGGGGTNGDDTNSTDSGTGGDGDDATGGGESDPDGDGDDTAGGGSGPSTGNETDTGNSTTAGGGDSSSESDGEGGGSDNEGGNDGSDTPGGEAEGDDEEDDPTGEGGTGGDDGDNTTGGGSNTTDDQDPNGGVGGGDDGPLDNMDADSDESDDSDRDILVAGLESQEDDDNIRAGGYVAIAAALLLLLLLLFAAGRRRSNHTYMNHKQLADDFEDDDTYLKDEASNGEFSSPRNLSGVVDETDGSTVTSVYTSGLVSPPPPPQEGLGNPYGRAPRSRTRDVHACSSATCDLCEARRQSGLQFVPTGMPSHSSSLPYESTRRYVSEDTVTL